LQIESDYNLAHRLLKLKAEEQSLSFRSKVASDQLENAIDEMLKLILRTLST